MRDMRVADRNSINGLAATMIPDIPTVLHAFLRSWIRYLPNLVKVVVLFMALFLEKFFY